MKYILFIISLITLFLLSACTTTPNLTLPSSSHTGSTTSIPTTGFIISDNISQSSGLITFLQTLTLDQLIVGKYKELIDYKTSRIRVFKLHEEDLIKLGYPKKLENLYDYRLYLILQDGISKQAFWSDQYTPLPIQYGGINEKHIYTLNNNNIEGTGKILYKNFESIIATGVTSFLTSPYNDDIAIQIIEQKEKPEVITFEGNGESSSTITITHDIVIKINNKELERKNNTYGSIIILQTFQSDGTLIYEFDESKGEGYADKIISIMSYKDNNRKIIDTWTGNFLAGNYNIISTDTNAFMIGRSHQERPNDIQESRSTITTGILNIVENQEKAILKRYRLINQKKYQEAYNAIENPDITYQQFTDQWQNYSLISVESISNPFIAFDSYEEKKRDSLEDYNTFSPRIFVQNQNNEIGYIDSLLRVIDNKIIIEKSPIKLDSNNNYTPSIEREKIIKLYYHLIANQQFKQAYDMQYTHNQTLEQFINNYKDILGVAIKQIDDMVYDSNGNGSYSSSKGTNGPMNILIDFISNDSVERHYIKKEIINGKIKHIDSKKTTESCVGACGYGYKPIIYLYPKEKTDINVYLPLQGEFTVTYPPISKDSTWNVTAQPNGTLINKEDQKEYSYLFREGKMNKPWHITQGFVVKNEDTITFLQEKLAYLGLTPKEYNEFIVYRRPLMMKNKYNIISFLGNEYTQQAPLTISPKPDSIQRVFMVFQGSDKEIILPLQKLQPRERKGFAVVERGGAEI